MTLRAKPKASISAAAAAAIVLRAVNPYLEPDEAGVKPFDLLTCALIG